MKNSSEIKAISQALLKAQIAIDFVKKDAKNPFYNSKYATLPNVIEAVKEPLNSAGIVFLQPVMGDVVETILIHAESGEWVSGEVKIVNAKPNDPQAQGSAITYARRQGLLAILSVPTEDDDANSAIERPTTPPARPTQYQRTYKNGSY